MEQNESTKITLQYIRRDLDKIAGDVHEIRQDIRQGYVSKEIFEARVGRLEKLVYGVVSIVLTAFMMAVAGLVFLI